MDKEEFFKKLNGLDILDGNLTDNDAEALMGLAKSVAKDNCLFLDIGSWKGKSTICLAVVAAKHNGRVFALDHWQGVAGTRTGELTNVVDVFNIFRTNLRLVTAQEIVSTLYMPSDIAHRILQDELFDLIYLDADNSYTEYYWTIIRYLPKLKPKGIFCGRNLRVDYYNAKVEIDLNITQEYIQDKKWHPGIIKAVYDVFGKDYEKIENSSVWWYKKNGLLWSKKPHSSRVDNFLF